jgi:hypothetical protein
VLEALLHDPGVDALTEQHRGVGVTQVMKADLEALLRLETPPDAVEVRWPPGSTTGNCEHELGVAPAGLAGEGLVGPLCVLHGLPLACNTDLRENERYLVAKGVPFREAHHLAGALVRDCLGRDVALDDASLKDLRRMGPVFDDDYAAALDPRLAGAQGARRRLGSRARA